MPRYPFDSHLNDLQIRHIAAGTVYAEIALTVGNWGTGILERIIFSKKKGEFTGFFSKMRDLGIAPDTTRTKLIIKALQPKLADLWGWLNHTYWYLLIDTYYDPEFIDKALRSVRGSIHKYTWVNEPNGITEGPGVRYESDRKILSYVANYKNFDALVILTAWAREAREQGILRTHAQCASSIRNIFPEVVCKTPHLFLKWPLLANRYYDLFWNAPEAQRMVPWLSMNIDTLVEDIATEEKKAREHGVNLPSAEIVASANRVFPLYPVFAPE